MDSVTGEGIINALVKSPFFIDFSPTTYHKLLSQCKNLSVSIALAHAIISMQILSMFRTTNDVMIHCNLRLGTFYRLFQLKLRLDFSMVILPGC
jgi:hypothetical protein